MIPPYVPPGNDKNSIRLRNLITAFMCVMIILIMLCVQDLYERGHKPVEVVTKYDTVFVAKPVTLVVNNHDYTVELGDKPVIEDDDPGQDNLVLHPLTDNGDITKTGFRPVTKFRRTRYDTTTNKRR